MVSTSIGAVTIIGADRFRFRGRELSWAALRDTLTPVIEQARAASCKHFIEVSTDPLVSATSVVRSLNTLRSTFYIELHLEKERE